MELNVIIYCLHIYKCVSSMNLLLHVLLYIYVYTMDTLRVWPVLTITIDIIGQSTMCMLEIYVVDSSKLLHLYYHYTPLLLMLTPPNFQWVVTGDCLNGTSTCLKNISILSGILIAYTMALPMNSAHIICYHIVVSWSVDFWAELFLKS